MTSSAPDRAGALLALTGARLLAGPLIAGFLLWLQSEAAPGDAAAQRTLLAAAAAAFALAAATDWLDGFLARRWNAVTPLGAALDHAADKALVAPVLLALAFGILPLDLAAAAMLIVARDIAVAGLREGLSAAGRTLPVGPWGKVKAAAEMAAIVIILALPALSAAAPGLGPALETLARGAMWLAAGLALWSAALYARIFFTDL
ncbi:MAG: CDP-diacylglycerol--glycerol-3-phosphate 3-phosphatidyltransferase [Alphaproteobacteria bacterium]|nr:CDP-diacylglycerol--glycerol-3-phosphate 3-phosphatidyltransferase [Alphaproteobacteria bacterium]